MSHGNDHGWGRDLARRLGIGGTVERLDGQHGATLHIRCAGKNGEGHVVDVSIRPNLDPNGTAKQMLNAGWTLGRRKIFCPDCGRRRKANRTPEQKVEQSAMPLPMIPPEVTPDPAPSGRTLAQQKMMAITAGRRSDIVRKGNLTRAAKKAGTTPPKPSSWATMTPAERMAHARASVSPEKRREYSRMGQEARRRKRDERERLALVAEENRLKEQGRIPAAPCSQIKEPESRISAVLKALPDKGIMLLHAAVETIKETETMATQETASEKARAAKRAVMQWLDEAFNVEKGIYRAGISDASIAKETGVSEVKVKALREEFYGPLGEPDEMRALRGELAAAQDQERDRHAAAIGEIARIGRKFEALCARQGWPVA